MSATNASVADSCKFLRTWSTRSSFPNFPGCQNDGTYDFIIVGAGSAGSVLVDRLSEISKWTVLLLEAGKMENEITDIPAEDRNLWLTDYNWGYVTTPQLYKKGNRKGKRVNKGQISECN